MYHNQVYKCDLLSITKDIRVNNDESVRKNIADAKTEVVTTVMVQGTWRYGYFKEIITGRLIPAYRVITYNTRDVVDGIRKEVPKYPCFVKYEMELGIEDTILSNSLVAATSEEVSAYINEHKNKDDYALYLYEVFKRGERFYNESKAKGIVSDEKQIKQMLKSLKSKS